MGKYCGYNYCDGNHKRSFIRSNTNSQEYLKMALNNSTNNKLMTEKLQKCQETMLVFKKQTKNRITSKRGPQLSEIEEEENSSEQKNSGKVPDLILPTSHNVLRQMLQLQIDIRNILRT